MIFDARSPHHLSRVDILVEKGKVSRIAKTIKAEKRTKVIKSGNLCVSPGWVDIGCYNGEPGYEYREDLDSLMQAASAGGYCRVATFPTSTPTVDSKAQISYLTNRSSSFVNEIVPIAALTKGRLGKEIADLLDLKSGGAVAFSDGNEGHFDHALLQRALLYLKRINGSVIYSACPKSRGQVHEGEISVQMGLEGIPSHEESGNVAAAINEADYTESPILIHNVSSSESLRHIKDSENATATVSFMNLIYEDQDQLDFSLNLKVHPPLRAKKDRKALCKAVREGVIGAITSNHYPLSQEEKDQPFGLSKTGASTLETVFASLNTMCKELDLETIIHSLSIGPSKLLQLKCPILEKGSDASLTIFDPNIKSEITRDSLRSKSLNNPFINQTLEGKVLGIINGTRQVLT